MKASRASQKSYIQARATASDVRSTLKAKLGWTIEIVGEFVVFAQGAGLKKAQVC